MIMVRYRDSSLIGLDIRSRLEFGLSLEVDLETLI